MKQALAELVEEKALAVRKERENSIVPLCGHVDRRRKQIVQVNQYRFTKTQRTFALVAQQKKGSAFSRVAMRRA